MARSPKSPPSKARRGGKGQAAGGGSKTRASSAAASKKATAKKGASAKNRSASKRAPARAQPQAASWGASVESLLTSELGREILADVLNATAGVLRQNREMGRQAEVAGRAMIDRGTDLASTAVNVGTEVASGAVDTSADITAAAVDIAQTAAGTLAAVATNAVLNMLPGAQAGNDQDPEGGAGKDSREGRPGRE